ncbi:MAG: flavodoxin family protein [Actinomycetota bacterium]|nr:flavodoxin family protein [Actinomycetota bacterium]MDD5667965.1 flavodoxin family protein [Actinomycetota bacterium]
MAKVLLVSASPRRKGNTAQLVEMCAGVIEDNGVEAEVLSLAGKEIRSCLACGKCAKLGECVQDDGLNEIIASLKEAGGFIVATPVYFGTARGDLMCALQRIGMVSSSTDGFLSRKVGGPIAVARRGGHTATIQELLMFYLINDMIVPGSRYWNMVFGRDPGEAMEDEEGVAVVRRFAENVAWLVARLEE